MRSVAPIAFVALALLTGLWGCRGLPQLAPLPTTHEMPVQQLVFHCDFDLPSDHRLIREVTSERDEVYHTLGLPWSDEPIQVYLFGDKEDYGQYLARQFPSVPSRRAFFVETDTELAVYAHWSDRVAEDLRHEVAHGYLHAAVPNLPLWLDEGLAEYFEVPRGQAGLNRPHLQLLRDMMEHEGWQPNLPRLEHLSSAQEMQQLDYAESWAWAYFLLESDPEDRALLSAHLAELRDQGSAEPLSTTIATRHADPNKALVSFLAALPQEGTPTHRSDRAKAE
jgi:Protein of unknown function (DUF1570)